MGPPTPPVGVTELDLSEPCFVGVVTLLPPSPSDRPETAAPSSMSPAMVSRELRLESVADEADPDSKTASLDADRRGRAESKAAELLAVDAMLPRRLSPPFEATLAVVPVAPFFDSKLFFRSAMVNELDLDAGLPSEAMDAGLERTPCPGGLSSATAPCSGNSFSSSAPPAPLLFLHELMTFLRLIASTLFFLRTRRFSCCGAFPDAGGGDTLLCEMEERPLETAESVSESSAVGGAFLLLTGGTVAPLAVVVFVDGDFTLPVLYTAKGFRLNAGEYLDDCPDFHGGVESDSLWPEDAGGRLICLALLASAVPAREVLLAVAASPVAAAADRPISSRLCDLPPPAPPAAALSDGGRVRAECVMVTRLLCDVRSAEETLFTFGRLCSKMELALAPPPLLTLWTT